MLRHPKPYPTLQSSALRLGRAGQVETVEVHDLVPDSNEVLDKLILGIRAAVDLSSRAQLGVRAENEVGAGGGPLLVGLAVNALENFTVLVGSTPRDVRVKDVDEELVGELARRLGQDTVRGAIPVGVESTETTEEDGGLGHVEGELVRPVKKELLGANTLGAVAVVAERVGVRLKMVERLGVGLLLGGIGAAGCERHGGTSGFLQGSNTA